MKFYSCRDYVTVAKYNFGIPWGWYKCIETCRSDYNINFVKIKNIFVLYIVGWSKNCIQDVRYTEEEEEKK